jgi:hypothetical protein
MEPGQAASALRTGCGSTWLRIAYRLVNARARPSENSPGGHPAKKQSGNLSDPRFLHAKKLGKRNNAEQPPRAVIRRSATSQDRHHQSQPLTIARL